MEGMQDCCGGAGVYNLSEPEMSESLLADKIGKAQATEAEVLVTANPGCHMQLGSRRANVQRRLPRRARRRIAGRVVSQGWDLRGEYRSRMK